MNNDGQLNLALCWYELDDWCEIKKTALDAEEQDDTFEEWKANANSAIAEIRANGQHVVKIAMKPKEFFAWCIENGFENNAEARSEYAARKLKGRRRET